MTSSSSSFNKTKNNNNKKKNNNNIAVPHGDGGSTGSPSTIGSAGVEETLGDFPLKTRTDSTDDGPYLLSPCDFCRFSTRIPAAAAKQKTITTKVKPLEIEEDRQGGIAYDWSDEFKDEGENILRQKNTFDDEERDGPLTLSEPSEETNEGSQEEEEGDGGDDDGSDHSVEMKGGGEDAKKETYKPTPDAGADGGEPVCIPHKLHVLQEEIKLANNGTTSDGHYAIINKLHELGVTVYVVGRADVESDANLMASVKHITRIVTAEENREEKQRCLLYQDGLGRIYNLTLGGKVAGLAGTWESSLLTFSAFEAIMALMILSRTIPCVRDLNADVRPAYLSLILGLVLSEEISHVRMHVSMLMRGTPSISAYALLEDFITDWPRKLVILLLAMAGAAFDRNDRVATYLTFSGVFLALLILAANLGSRAWFHIGGRPLNHQGYYLGVFYAYLQAVAVGLLFPHLAHRQVAAGGKVAMETMLRCAFFVALAFVASDIDEVQRFVVVGSENCDQSWVNVVGGFWWAATLMLCILRVRSIPLSTQEAAPEDEETLLVPDQDSPVGFRVPHLPNFAVDPARKSTGWPCLNLCVEQVLGILMALVGGLLMVSLAYRDGRVETVYDLF